MIEFPEQPSEGEIQEKLKEMYRTLLSGNDQRFFEVQAWVFQLSESEWFGKLPTTLQDNILGCLDQYRLECRVPADNRDDDADWSYPYFLAGG